MSYSYFFAYTTALAVGGTGYGNYATTLSHPVRNYADIEFIASCIRAKNPGNTDVVITSWQRFEAVSDVD